MRGRRGAWAPNGVPNKRHGWASPPTSADTHSSSDTLGWSPGESIEARSTRGGGKACAEAAGLSSWLISLSSSSLGVRERNSAKKEK